MTTVHIEQADLLALMDARATCRALQTALGTPLDDCDALMVAVAGLMEQLAPHGSAPRKALADP